MKIILPMVTAVCMISLCSCATHNPIHPTLPPETSFLPTDGHSQGIFVNLRLADGENLLCLLDTGRPNTVLDKSLEPKLGKRLGTRIFWEPLLGGVKKAGVYEAPELYLGNARLLTRRRIYTYDWQHLEPGLQGVIGMDSLRHYCIQLDFARDKIRFLDPDRFETGDLGQGYPLTLLWGLLIAHANCFGVGNVYFCPDTGCGVADAMFKPKFFNRELHRQRPVWTNQFTAYPRTTKWAAGISSGVFGGNTYSNLIILEWAGTWPDGDLVGLPFLARNLVTFDFPKRVMYLKPEIAGPRYPNPFLWLDAGNFLGRLTANGQLPGWAKNDHGEGETSAITNSFADYPVTFTFNLHKRGAPSWVDITSKIKSLAAGGVRHFSANNALAGCDPAPDIVKRLQVTYRVHGRQQTAEATEGKRVVLPAGAEVIQARYGDLQAPSAFHPGTNSDTSTYHYSVILERRDEAWKLQRAWQTDANGRTIKEYPLP